MTLLPSPIALLSLLLSSAILYANPATSNRLRCEFQHPSYENVVGLLQQDNLSGALDCMTVVYKSDHKNFDYFSMLVRLLTWNQMSGKAHRILGYWPERNADFYYLQGDVFWYENRIEAAVQSYDHAWKLRPLPLIDAHLNYLKSMLLLKGQSNLDQQQKLQEKITQVMDMLAQEHQNDPRIQEFTRWSMNLAGNKPGHEGKREQKIMQDSEKMIFHPVYSNQIDFAIDRALESQKQDKTHVYLQYSHDFSNFALLSKGGAMQYNYADSSLRSHYFGFGIRTIPQELNLALNLEGRLPQSDPISPHHSVELSAHYKFAAKNILGFELYSRFYDLLIAQIGKLSWESYFERSMLNIAMFQNLKNTGQRSWVVAGQHLFQPIAVGLIYSFGVGDAQRSYLSGFNESEFKSVGVKLSTESQSCADYFLLGEKKWEDQFYSLLFSVGMRWKY